jgi:alkylation response protein AidB-like acyl-CoA dehydrogenase
MDFMFTQEQEAIARVARRVLGDHCSPRDVRAAFEGELPGAGARWDAIAAAGIAGLCIPEVYGGQGLGPVEMVLVLEEAGRVCLPDPLLETAWLVPALLLEAGTDEQQRRWLPRIATGEVVASLRAPGSELVVAMDRCGLVLWTDDHGWSLAEVPSLPSVSRRSLDRGLGLGRITDRELDREPISGEVGDPTLIARIATGSAALLNGLSDWLMAVTTRHVRTREQFGRPIGSFQAVKHMLAEVATDLHAARVATWFAAEALSRVASEAHEAADIARWTAASAALLASDAALQLHGGIGFTWEHDLHLWMKRVSALVHLYGGHEQSLSRIESRVCDDLVDAAQKQEAR